MREPRHTNYILSLKNKEVIEFNNSTGLFKIINEELIPYGLKNIVNVGEWGRLQTLMNWLTSRHIPLDRANAKRILNSLQLPQHDPLAVILECRALSLNDAYWLKYDSADKWEDYNLYENSFSEVLSNIAIVGVSKGMTVSGVIHTPEVTTQGTYAKCWRRENNSTYLYKTNYSKRESEAEYISHIIANVLGINSVPYELSEIYGRICSKCENIANTNISISPIYNLLKDKQREFRDIHDFYNLFEGVDQSRFLEMLIFDGVIGNTDRHLLNWGFFTDPTTNEYLGLHPLFDHNCAIDIEIDFSKTISPIVPNITNQELSIWALRRKEEMKPKIDRLNEWYHEKETKKLFKQVYNRYNELEYLKTLLKQLYPDVKEPEKKGIISWLK